MDWLEKTKWIPAIALLLFLSCGTDKDEDANDNNKNDRLSAAGGADWGCGEIVYEAVAWDASTDIGVMAQDVFEPIEGSCTAPLSWDAAPMGSGMCEPEFGESDLTLALSFHRDSAEIGRFTEPSEEGQGGCTELFLKASADASVVSADGVFDDTGVVEVVYSSETGLMDATLKKSADALGGTFSVVVDDDASAELTYRFGGAEEECAGIIALSVSQSLKGGVGQLGMGEIGSWSATGCPLGTDPVALDKATPAGKTIMESYNEIWGEQHFDVTWDTGKQTTLNIAVAISDTHACQKALGVEVPARIAYSTDDGMLGERTVYGIAGMTLTDAGDVRGLSFDLDDDRVCSGTTGNIEYGFGDCSTLSGVIVQLRMQWFEGEWGVSDDALITYEYGVGSTPGLGPSMNNHELSFSF